MEASFLHNEICRMLGRTSTVPDYADLRKAFAGQTIMVTGAAGSIGSELVLQLVRLDPKMVVLLDQAESPLHDLSMNLIDNGVSAFVVQLADVTNAPLMRRLLDKFRPDIIFHAAAYKHVPLLEGHVAEALNTNVVGTMLLADLAPLYGVKQFVLLSTDKAVKPASVMGATKRLCEQYVLSLFEQQRAEGKQTVQYIVTRFGNVAGSTGSVIPRFLEQIEKGGPVTITHPDIARFFMTPYEACHLMLEAAAMGKGGEVFVFEMGQELKISALAERLIALSGDQAQQVEIVYTGLRPGEKLSEELFVENELISATAHPSIRQANQPPQPYQKLVHDIDALVKLIWTTDNKTLKDHLARLLPDYKPQQEV